MADWPLLSLAIFLPSIAAAGVALFPRLNPRLVALSTALISSILVGRVVWEFDPAAGVQSIQRVSWIPALGVDYFVGVDGLSIAMLLLTQVITVVALIATPQIERPRAFYALVLLLQTGLLGTFAALDMFLFYVFFELSLLPMFFLIGMWGGPRRDYAALKFFLYTLVGSIFILLGIVVLYLVADHRFDLVELATMGRSGFFDRLPPIGGVPVATLLFGLFFVGFAIKIPVVPLHTWLPDAHVEASTPVSALLAGVLLKLGAYGLLRFNLSLFPSTAAQASTWMGALGVVCMLYGALLALGQRDMKRMVAYSSISHMGFVMLGIAAATPESLSGAVFQMFGHGLVSPMLFLIVGVLYERSHSRDLDNFGGLAAKMPLFATLAGIAFFAGLGLPGLVGFVGEALVLLGSFVVQGEASRVLRTCAVVGLPTLALGAGYFLWAYRRIFFGGLSPRSETLDPRLQPRELISLVILALPIILLGIYPTPILKLGEASLQQLVKPAGTSP